MEDCIAFTTTPRRLVETAFLEKDCEALDEVMLQQFIIKVQSDRTREALVLTPASGL